MKKLFSHHKYQAFYIACLAFMPLILILLHSNNLFKTQIKKEDSFALAIKQFIHSNPTKEIQNLKTITKQETPKITKTHQLPKKAKIPAPSHPLISSTQNPKAFKPSNASNTQNISLKQEQNNPSLLKQIQQAIQQAQIYPKQARKMRMQGIVKVEFLWTKNKGLKDLKIIQSSGYDLLDKSALKSIRKASLYFPYYENDLKIILPIAYELS
ncbi:energy transducer TonB [Campylobacter sp. VicNov18]|uniref:energy transducer TonB n=1 Tax=Campylobacter bilis TaxID=2691918 RepID=UPI00130DA65D|nr:energy transducer TonB [Campylobacter bilis]MPV63760.1 TonB family protein [Campylobacter hepaticus]MBM0637261.1 TonB family protein [Campylobacter bilis]MCC8277980.1 energy transducer TonB [Campylobacter bilis]MCC8299484.1 energy transducer TonB [Campylobacter bilis]MCC8300889.1 energy transducer TonB [Campylobacter bilis]